MSLYIYFDMLAMNFSLIAAIILCQISLGRTSNVRSSMEMATSLNFYSLLYMDLAFTFILAMTLQEHTGFFIITFQVFLFVLTQYGLSFRLIVSNAKSVFGLLF
ncbi:hypothetical protein NC652_039728 [Populus alba x Populus x berolinensis]|nr:hypothetical protein NC652_039728 [Populus alba x Populus x berolinensis]